jgi:DNA invertase Pin-like site-specific DNA recombinase
MNIGYVRVSTVEQNTIRQEVLMQSLNVEKIFIDKASGKNKDREELKKLLNFARNGDTVIVESISRFARNTKDLLELVELLTKKGVEFVSRKESIDTTTPTGKFMLIVFGAVAELEREYILQRQKEGIEIAKKNGKYKGRQKIKLNNFDEVYNKWTNKEISAVKAMRVLGISKSTFYRRAKIHI